MTRSNSNKRLYKRALKFIRLNRESQCISKRELCRRSGLSLTYVCMMDTGAATASKRGLMMLAHGLGLDDMSQCIEVAEGGPICDEII